jgi:hypothetical protein
MQKIPRLTNEELKNLPKQCFPFNTGDAVIIDKETLRMICDELISKREKEEILIKAIKDEGENYRKLETILPELPRILEKIDKYIEK